MVNASFGMKWADGKVITSLKGTNLTNETIQQHVYGDIMKIVGGLRGADLHEVGLATALVRPPGRLAPGAFRFLA